ncbi:hypothetical protein N0V82_003059 [Gnomoniopsis sp. IMI 355080]|nr:hypothetical protein N0V82_003059 [Gnomoniopsis sp. IMI 355080]
MRPSVACASFIKTAKSINMAGVRKSFSLCETVAGALHTIGEAYGIDGCWLPWQFEKHVLNNQATPFQISTDEYPRNLKDGVDKVCVEVHYYNDNPNLVKYIRFEELPSKEKYIVTQTSMKHVQDDAAGASCTLWIEIPKGAEREGIAGVPSRLKAKICCAEWKDHLSPTPETEIERAQLYVAQDNVEWLKRQLIFKDSQNNNLSSSLAFQRTEITTLTAAISKLNEEVANVGCLNVRIGELKAEVKAEIKAKQDVIDVLEAKLKGLSADLEKSKVTLKEKNGIITKLRRDLKAKDNLREDSGPKSPIQVKKRKWLAAVKTPKGKGRARKTTPYTAPGRYGSSSSLSSAPSSQNLALTPDNTIVTGRTPLPSSRPQGTAFSFGDTSVVGRTRSATRASLSVGDTPTASTRHNVPSVITVSSCSDLDGDVFN